LIQRRSFAFPAQRYRDVKREPIAIVANPLQREVASRFGLVPNFFVAEPEAFQ
jgi:hypothetical protein